MIEISPHARDAMQKHSITEDEVVAAVVDGEVEFELFVKKEKRYGSVLTGKQRKIIAIWAYKGNKKRIITCYPLRREI